MSTIFVLAYIRGAWYKYECKSEVIDGYLGWAKAEQLATFDIAREPDGFCKHVTQRDHRVLENLSHSINNLKWARRRSKVLVYSNAVMTNVIFYQEN